MQAQNDFLKKINKLNEFVVKVKDYQADGISGDEAISAVLDEFEADSKEDQFRPLMTNYHTPSVATEEHDLEVGQNTSIPEKTPSPRQRNIFDIFYTRKSTSSQQQSKKIDLKTETDKQQTSVCSSFCNIL